MKWNSGVQRWGQPLRDIEEVDATDLDAGAFQSRYVDRCRPLLIRAATRHWRAARKWGRSDYLASALHDKALQIHREPVLEMRWRQRRWPDRFGEVFAAQRETSATYPEFARLAGSDETVFAYAVGVDESTCLAPLRDDIGGFDFIAQPGRPHYYKPVRAFVHGISYTDWHYHPDDSTLMCQFVRAKTVHLLPPDKRTWDAIVGVAEHENRIGPADPERYPRLKSLRPLAAELRHGDALYIPPNWWHAVSCHQSAPVPGVTVAWCWASPLHLRLDPRFPFHGLYLRHGPLKRRLQLVAAGAAWHLLSLTGKTLRTIPGSPDAG